MKKVKAAVACLVFFVQVFGLSVLAAGISADVPAPFVLASYSYPPLMEDPKDGGRPGFAVEVVREVFRKMGTPLRIDFYPLPRALKVLENKDADGIFTIKKNPDREKKYIFSRRALINQDYVIFVNRDSAFRYTGDLGELENKSIGILNGTYYGPVFDKAVKKKRFRKLELAFSHESNFKKLVSHRMDVVLCSRIVGVEIVKRLSLADQIIVSGPPVDTADSYLMLDKSHGRVMAAFDREFAALRADGTIDAIWKKYDGSP